MFASRRVDKVWVSVKIKGKMSSCILCKPWGRELGRGMAGAKHGGCQIVCVRGHEGGRGRKEQLHSKVEGIESMFSRK